jgi:hypothetical protein
MTLGDRAAAVEKDPFVGDHANLGDMFTIDFPKNRKNLLLTHQAGASPRQPGLGSLIDPDIMPIAAEQSRREQAAKGTTDDPDTPFGHF